MLRLLARTISQLWAEKPADAAAVHLHHIDPGHEPIRQEVVTRLGQSAYIPAIANDVAAGAVVRERSGSQRITYADVAELALHFKVGFRAAVWRLESLRHTSKAESSALLAQSEVANRYVRMLDGNRPTAGAASQPVRDSSPDSGRKARHDRALRSRLVRLAIEAFRQEVISRGRLLDIGRKLDIDEDELLDLAWAARPH